MKINRMILFFFCLTSWVSFAFSEEADQWVTVPITSRFVDRNSGVMLEEQCLVEFPNDPEILEIPFPGDGEMPSHYQACDSEEVLFYFGAIPAHIADYDEAVRCTRELPNYVENMILLFDCENLSPPEAVKSWKGHTFLFIHENRLYCTTVIAGRDFVFALNTDVFDDVFLDYNESELDIDFEEKLISTMKKTERFVHSFRLID